MATLNLKNETQQQTVMLIPFNIEEAKETGFYVSGTSGSGKTLLAKKLASFLIHAGITVIGIDTSQAWNKPDSPLCNNVIEIRSPLQQYHDMELPIQNCVFDISRLAIHERFMFTNALCKAIMSQRVNHPNPNSLPWIFIIFEEAQLYLSNGCMRSLKKYGNVLDVVTVGRNYNVRFGIITQFPANVDKAPVKITQQRYFGWTTEKNDLTYLRGFLEKADIEKVKKLRKFKTENKVSVQFIYQYRDKTELITIEHDIQTQTKQEQYSYNVETTYNLQGQTMRQSVEPVNPNSEKDE